jgi:glycosyltransferase involved in cell wall biosynthesis
MRILMTARRWAPDVRSGTETVFENLWLEAQRAGHEVRLVVGYRNSPQGFPPDAVAVDLRGGGPAAYAAMERAAVAEARRFRPDVVLSNSIEVRVPGLRNVIIVHDLNFGAARTNSLAHRARELLYRAQGLSGATIVAVSDATAQRLAGIGLKSVVIRNGVDVQRFHPAAASSDGPVRFVYPSRMLPGKGQHLALDAFGRLRPDQRKGWELVLVGANADPDYVGQLRVQALAGTLGASSVSILTDVPDMVPWYQSAHVVLFPTRMEEGFGFTAVEGMACGKPVIWSEQPAIREATGGIGVPVAVDDVEGLKKAMWTLGTQPEERARLGIAGREYVQRYAWSAVWQRYEAVLRG